MAIDSQIERILRLYPDDCRPHSVESVVSTDGFSGARLWRVIADRGLLCLRQWPAGHPNQQRLEFIQAVLWHVDQEGFHQVPIPLETRHHHGYIWHAGHLWELAPWLEGEADYRQRPSIARLQNAMSTLARFHVAAASFPLPDAGPAGSPGISERAGRLEALLGGRLGQIRAALDDRAGSEFAMRGGQLCALAAAAGPVLLPKLHAGARLRVSVQPCIRDIWHPHVLFIDDEVSGIVDFGAMRPDNVATDIARLLGSLAVDNRADWQRGLTAYQRIRPLSDDELTLVAAFDRSGVLMSGLQWLEWIYLEERTFTDHRAVLQRIDEFCGRLHRLVESIDA